MLGATPTQPGRWESPQIPLPASGVHINVVASHGRGTVPLNVEWVLVCQQTDAEYVPGDEIQLLSGYNDTSSPTVWKNATQIGAVFNAGLALAHYSKFTVGNTNLTRTKWAIKAYCLF